MRTLRYRGAAALAVAALLLTATGCTTSHTTTDPGMTLNAQDRTAQEALNRWEALFTTRGTNPPFLVVADPNLVIGDRSGADAEGFKQAMLAGRLSAAIPLPTSAPPNATLRWPGGGATTVAVLSAADALKALQTPTSPPCRGCAQPEVLNVTSVGAGMTHLASSSGPVDAPTWVFSFEGHREKIARLAIRQDAPLFVMLSTGPYQSDYQPTATASISDHDRALTVVDTADRSCGTVATGHVFESAHVVSFVVTTTPATSAPRTCQANNGATVAVALSSPLGTRLVLDNGMPISVTRTGE